MKKFTFCKKPKNGDFWEYTIVLGKYIANFYITSFWASWRLGRVETRFSFDEWEKDPPFWVYLGSPSGFVSLNRAIATK